MRKYLIENKADHKCSRIVDSGLYAQSAKLAIVRDATYSRGQIPRPSKENRPVDSIKKTIFRELLSEKKRDDREGRSDPKHMQKTGVSFPDIVQPSRSDS